MKKFFDPLAARVRSPPVTKRRSRGKGKTIASLQQGFSNAKDGS